MLVGNKRKAYYRLPVHEIIYSPNGHSGRSCAKDMTLILKVSVTFYPTYSPTLTL